MSGQGNSNSRAIYEAIEPTMPLRRRQVLTIIRCRPAGITMKEVAAAMGVGFNTVSGRGGELIKAGLVTAAGYKRAGSEVLRATPAQMSLLEVA
jgi:predicted transcriptional regulator